MARVTVEDCLENVDNRFELVLLATRRARQLSTSSMAPLIDDSKHNKPAVIALREIAEGYITPKTIEQYEQTHQEEIQESP